MRLVRAANERLAGLRVDHIQEENKQQSYVTVAVLLSALHEHLLVLRLVLERLDVRGNLADDLLASGLVLVKVQI